MSDSVDLSIIVCLYCEEECVEEFVQQVFEALAEQSLRWEMIFVDDGSTDKTVPLVADLARRHSQIRLIALSCNHGKEAAITAGVTYAAGEYMILMDPDLQDPPFRIMDFYKKANEGFDLVWGIRQQQSRGLGERIASLLFWRSLRGLTGLAIPTDVAVMRAFNRRFATAFLQFPERNRFIEGVFATIGMKTTTMAVENQPRFAGRSKFTVMKRIRLATKAITSFSDRPLLMTIAAGAFGLMLSSGFTAYLFARKLFFDVGLTGWTSTIAAIVFMGSLNLITVGLTGLYVGRIYREVKGRPIFIVKDTWNISKALPTDTDQGESPTIPGATIDA